MNKPNIQSALLWEYDLETFNYDKSYKIVIERVLERGSISEWREVLNYYGVGKIIETVSWSAQLRESDKKFALFFLKSDLLHAA